jgi:hypothetical protein
MNKKSAMFVFLMVLNISLIARVSNSKNFNGFIKTPDSINNKWAVHHAELIKCYVYDVNSSIEILRLYKDKFYEYCKYRVTPKNRSILSRDTGRYVVAGPFLFLKNAVRGRKYIASRKSIYLKGFDNLFTLTSLKKLSKDKQSKYNKPFYIDPNYGTIVEYQNVVDKIDIKELVFELTKNLETEQEKFDVIAEFISSSLEYGRGDRLGNKHDFAASRLAGKKRRVVCAGYSQILKELCDIANIKCEYVVGASRSMFFDINHISSSNHAWNIVRIDSVYRTVDITWAADNSSRWLNTPQSVMLYSHIPKLDDNQLLDQPIKKEIIDRSPIITPLHDIKNAPKTLPNYSPLNGLCYEDSVFTFVIDTIVSNLNISTSDISDFEFIYGIKMSICYVGISNSNIEYINGKTIVRVDIKDAVTAVSIDVDNSYNITYMVVKGGKNTYMKLLQRKSTNQNIDSYINGICASLYLNDKAKLCELVGNDNDLFFDKSGNINRNLIQIFSNWDGLVPIWHQTLELPEGGVVNALNFKNIHFIFSENDRAYEIVSIEYCDSYK